MIVVASSAQRAVELLRPLLHRAAAATAAKDETEMALGGGARTLAMFTDDPIHGLSR